MTFALILLTGYLMAWLGMARLWGQGVADFVGGVVAFIMGIIMWLRWEMTLPVAHAERTASDEATDSGEAE